MGQHQVEWNYRRRSRQRRAPLNNPKIDFCTLHVCRACGAETQSQARARQSVSNGLARLVLPILRKVQLTGRSTQVNLQGELID